MPPGSAQCTSGVSLGADGTAQAPSVPLQSVAATSDVAPLCLGNAIPAEGTCQPAKPRGVRYGFDTRE